MTGSSGKLATMIITGRDARWTADRHRGMIEPMHVSFAPDTDHQAAVSLAIRQALPLGGTVVLMDAEHPTHPPAPGGATPLFDPALFDPQDIKDIAVHVVRPHAALAAIADRGQPLFPINRRPFYFEQPFGLFWVAEAEDMLRVSTCVVQDQQVQQWDGKTGEDDFAITTSIRPTYLADVLSHHMAKLLQRTGDAREPGIIVAFEGRSRNLGNEIQAALSARFASTTHPLLLMANPSATLHGGITLAAKYAA